MTDAPPSEAGLVQLIVADCVAAIAITEVGAPGGVTWVLVVTLIEFVNRWPWSTAHTLIV